jgi:PleD family two-component response regulator
MARVPLANHHSTESLLKSGDAAMYEAKRAGKNRCHFQLAA